jgi:cell division protein FtsB
MDRFSYCRLAAALRRLVSTTLANLVTYAVAAALASPAALADEAALKAEIAELRAQVEQMKAQIKDLAAVSRPAPAPSPAVAASAARRRAVDSWPRISTIA